MSYGKRRSLRDRAETRRQQSRIDIEVFCPSFGCIPELPMKIPTSSQIVSYFKSIGAELTCIPGDRFTHDTFQFGQNSPYGQRTFRDARELWMDWRSHAAHLIRQRQMSAVYLAAWKGGTCDERYELEAAIRKFALTGDSELLRNLFRAPPLSTESKLPKNWKTLVKRILDRDDLRLFPARAMVAISSNEESLRINSTSAPAGRTDVNSAAFAAAIYPLRPRSGRGSYGAVACSRQAG